MAGSALSQNYWENKPTPYTLVRVGNPVTLRCKANINEYSSTPPHWRVVRHDDEEQRITFAGISRDDCCDVTGDITKGEVDLVIKSASLNDEGRWYCTPPSSLTVAPVFSKVLVIDGDPSCEILSKMGPNGEVIIGSAFILRCSIDGKATPPGRLVWSRDGKDTNTAGTSPIIFNHILQKEDNGRLFSCRLQHQSIPSPWKCPNDIIPDVQYPPVASGPDYICIEKGRRLSVYCSYVIGNPRTTRVRWTAPHVSHTMEDPLLIHDIQPGEENPSNYTCEVSNTYYNGISGQSSSQTTVEVQYAPEVSTPVLYQINEGDDLQILCSVNAMPSAEVTWVYPDASVHHGKTLRIPAIRRSQSGVYSCEATNEFCDQIGGTGRGSSKTLVVVNYAPYFLNQKINKQVAADEGESVTLQCDIDSNPRANITWFDKRGSEITNSSFYLQNEKSSDTPPSTSASLSILNVARSDYGDYKCAARNMHGGVAFIISLKHKSVPDQVTNVNVTTTADLIVVTWERGFDGGDEQMFYVEYTELPDGFVDVTDSSSDNIATIGGLKPEKMYNIRVVSFNSRGERRSDVIIWHSPESHTSNDISSDGNPTTIVVIATIGIVVACVMVIIVVVLRRMTRSRKSVVYEDITHRVIQNFNNRDHFEVTPATTESRMGNPECDVDSPMLSTVAF
ncbi:fasciclin-2-like [Ptychodera flava]|uniref:fasciclin-2-like n=1 Tax=Ptychodera flava TaxID=63121 RepID=UPI00396A5D2F